MVMSYLKNLKTQANRTSLKKLQGALRDSIHRLQSRSDGRTKLGPWRDEGGDGGKVGDQGEGAPINIEPAVAESTSKGSQINGNTSLWEPRVFLISHE